MKKALKILFFSALIAAYVYIITMSVLYMAKGDFTIGLVFVIFCAVMIIVFIKNIIHNFKNK